MLPVRRNVSGLVIALSNQKILEGHMVVQKDLERHLTEKVLLLMGAEMLAGMMKGTGKSIGVLRDGSPMVVPIGAKSPVRVLIIGSPVVVLQEIRGHIPVQTEGVNKGVLQERTLDVALREREEIKLHQIRIKTRVQIQDENPLSHQIMMIWSRCGLHCV
jgi:hypothetical protein